MWEELASRYTEVEDKLEAQARKLMVACSENTQDLKKLHSKEEMANIQTGIPRLLLRGKPCHLVSGGERIHLVRFPNPHYVVGWGAEPLQRG